MRRASVVAFLVALFPLPLVAQTAQVLTQHNDAARTGANLNETQLNVSNVNSRQFGLVFSLPVEGAVYAQPLYVPALQFPDGVHNVVYVATMHNNVYAYDADNPSGLLLWQKQLGQYVPQNFMPLYEATAANNVGEIVAKLLQIQGCAAQLGDQQHVNIYGGYGITGTPVIDRALNSLFVVAKTKESDANGVIQYNYYLHALDLSTGQEKDGSPVQLVGSVPSTSKKAVNGKINFNPMMQLQRPGLLLANGAVYIAFGAHQETPPYNGWIFSFDAKTFQPKGNGVFSTTPNADDGEGGIWQSGNGLVADSGGNIYFMTGNGPFDADQGGTDVGDSFVRLDQDLNLVDWFTPQDFKDMDTSDVDLGSAGPFLFVPPPPVPSAPPSPLALMGGGKKGILYVLDPNHMGHLEDETHGPLQQIQASQGVDDQAVNIVGTALVAAAAADSIAAGVAFATGNPGLGAALTATAVTLVTAADLAFSTNLCGADYHHIHGSPVVWNSPGDGPLVYVWGERDNLKAYKFDPVIRKFPSTSPAHVSSMKDPNDGSPFDKFMPGGILSVSANGSTPGTGILWASVPASGNAIADLAPGALRAFDAENVGHELWCASTGTFAKFNAPTVANGKVYLASFDNRISVYGLTDRSSFQSGFKAKSSPFVSDGFVYFQGTDDKLWKVNINDPTDNTWLGGYNTKSPPFVSGGYVYFQGKGSGDKDDRLYKVNVNNPNGDNTWLGGYKTKSSPFVSNGYVYFQGKGSGDKDDRLYKVNVNDPNDDNTWLGGYKTKSSPFVSNGYIYFQAQGSGDKGDRLYKVNVNNPNGDNTWLGGYKTKSSPFVYGRFAVFVADPNGGVFSTIGAPDQKTEPWQTVSQGNAGPKVRVTAVPYGGRFAAFTSDRNGGIFATAGTPDQGWAGWATVSQGNAGPGVSVTAVPYASPSGTRIAVFTSDRNGGIFATSGTPDVGWGSWATVSQGSAGPGVSVTAVPYGDKIAVLTSDRNGGIFTTLGTPDLGWAPWQPVPNRLAGAGVTVTAVPYGQRIAVFTADSNGGVFATAGAPDQQWEPWTTVSQGQAGPGVSVTAVPANGYVYFQAQGSGDKGDRLYKVNVDNPNGDNAWLGNLKAKSSPFVENGAYVYFQGTDNQLWRVSTDGTGLASPGCGNWTNSTPFVYGNRIFFQGTDDRLLMVGAFE